MPIEGAPDLLKRLVRAVYRAQSCQIATVVPNGYLVQCGAVVSRERQIRDETRGTTVTGPEFPLMA